MAILGLIVTACGCSDPSLELALRAQARADAVQRHVFDVQQDGLTTLLYRDVVGRLEAVGPALNAAQRAALSEAWNERDLIAFWAVQYERAAALRLAGVTAKLANDQSIVDLLIKSVERRVDRARAAVAAEMGNSLGE